MKRCGFVMHHCRIFYAWAKGYGYGYDVSTPRTQVPVRQLYA